MHVLLVHVPELHHGLHGGGGGHGGEGGWLSALVGGAGYDTVFNLHSNAHACQSILPLFHINTLPHIEHHQIQGDYSHCSEPPADTKTKVAL